MEPICYEKKDEEITGGGKMKLGVAMIIFGIILTTLGIFFLPMMIIGIIIIIFGGVRTLRR